MGFLGRYHWGEASVLDFEVGVVIKESHKELFGLGLVGGGNLPW